MEAEIRASGIEPSVARRKLADTYWAGRINGGSAARSVVASTAERPPIAAGDQLRLLFLGVGDVRNVLCSICDCSARWASSGEGQPPALEVHINDAVDHRLARSVLLLALASQCEEETANATEAFETFAAVWGNAALSQAQSDRMQKILESLLAAASDENVLRASFPWLKIAPSALAVLACLWRVWQCFNVPVETTDRVRRGLRFNLCQDSGAVSPFHASAYSLTGEWMPTGIAIRSKDGGAREHSNPTFFRQVVKRLQSGPASRGQ